MLSSETRVSEQPLWEPSPERAAAAEITAFRKRASTAINRELKGYGDLWRWSIEQPEAFWRQVWRDYGIIGDLPESAEQVPQAPMGPGARYMTGARLNFAENLLRGNGDAIAIVFRGETVAEQVLSRTELRASVFRLANALRAIGVSPGDRVAAILPNAPVAVIGMLATTAIGAIWSACSPDFGAASILDRFSQIEPRILFGVDGIVLNGRDVDRRQTMAAVAKALPTLEATIITGYAFEPTRIEEIPGARSYANFVAGADATPFSFERFDFNQPAFILFSSGTTGKPKCIVHGAGGTLLQHVKEHRLHCDVRPGERVFYATTCAWMMWNWLVSALASEATVVLYDGSPAYPSLTTYFDLADAFDVTLFGISARYIDALRKNKIMPNQTHQLKALKTVCSTGSPLSAESFEYIYDAIKADVHTASISGGTDIISCFGLGDPAGPVYRGEIQRRGLGMAVDVFDDEGTPVRNRKGELVCTQPFPSMPVRFWNDPDGEKYRAAYFDHFPGVWTHGDYAEITANDGLVIYGRSDAVLKPGGVRIGTAEIYPYVNDVEEVLESVAVGQKTRNDVRIVLFVKLRADCILDHPLTRKIQRAVREGASHAHVPEKIVQVTDIPRTHSGKITELAVRAVIHDEPVENKEALANPEALEQFRNRPELA